MTIIMIMTMIVIKTMTMTMTMMIMMTMTITKTIMKMIKKKTKFYRLSGDIVTSEPIIFSFSLFLHSASLCISS